MIPILKTILIKIQRSARAKSLSAAIKEANKICLETGKTMLIYFYEGEYKFVAKRDVKRQGYTAAEAEAIATAKIVKRSSKRLA
jgi:adenylosuccinate synthase